MKTVLFFIASFLIPGIFFGQSLNAPLRFTNYTVADGLPSNVVSVVLQDSRGFLWMGTSQGLARFDGHKFIVYNHSRADTNSMPYDNVERCIELNNHHLLFNCRTKMWMLNPFNHQQYAPPGFWKNKNYALISYLNENLVGIDCGDKIYFTDMNLQLIDSVNNPLQGNVSLYYLGNNKVLLSNLHQKGCYSIAERKWEEWKIKEEDFGNKEGYGVVWVDTINILMYMSNYFSGMFTVSYDPKNHAYLKPQRLANIDKGGFMVCKDDALMVSSDDRLTIFQKGKPTVFIDNSQNNNNNLPAVSGELFADNNGNFWVTGQNGVSRFKLNQSIYQYWKLPYAANPEFSTKYAGKIWIHSENHGSIYFETNLQRLQVIDSIGIGYCWGVVPVNNQIYIHGNDYFGKPKLPANNVKLLAYNIQTKKITQPSFLKPYYHDAELITMVFQSHNGDVWYSLNKGNGIVRQKANSNEFRQYRYTHNPAPFSFRYVNKAVEDSVGNIYFSVNKRTEILVWKKQEEHFEEWKPDSLLNMAAISFGPLVYQLIDSKQNLWLSYGSTGLMRYNLLTKKGKLYEIEDGLPANIIGNIVADADDNIWMPTVKGLVCLLVATNKFLVFTEQDGLPFTNFYESNVFYDKDDTTLYFGNTGNLFRVKTNDLLRRKQQNNISLYIDRMDVNNQPYSFTNTDDITLKPHENNLQFSFTIVDLDNAVSNINYEYSLTNTSDKPFWQKLNGTNIIAFNQLNPGSYFLQARMLDEANNTYVEARSKFHFTIATPWNKSWWFISLVSLGILLGVGALIRAYFLRRIEKQRALIEKQTALVNERKRIASDMHDDMGAGLSRIRYMSTGMKNEIKDEGLKKDFDKIIMSSDELVDNMNEIIWALNSSDEKLENVLYYIRSQSSEILDAAGITFQVTMPKVIPEKILSSEEKRNLHLVVKEAVHNIIKHAKASAVNMAIQIDNNLHITIKDNGIGFIVDESRLKGNGMGNFQKRMDSLKGSMDIQSGANGTTTVFIIPI
ncbi:MAG: two-component regulator propeller domain-containing protein [Ginsengibacter sp.]